MGFFSWLAGKGWKTQVVAGTIALLSLISSTKQVSCGIYNSFSRPAATHISEAFDVMEVKVKELETRGINVPQAVLSHFQEEFTEFNRLGERIAADKLALQEILEGKSSLTSQEYAKARNLLRDMRSRAAAMRTVVLDKFQLLGFFETDIDGTSTDGKRLDIHRAELATPTAEIISAVPRDVGIPGAALNALREAVDEVDAKLQVLESDLNKRTAVAK